ncbi:MAG: hypothetical protein C0475_02795, partial [Planctomyces sp.]|nr:hypothetical protein [Planctomyces sp.]
MFATQSLGTAGTITGPAVATIGNVLFYPAGVEAGGVELVSTNLGTGVTSVVFDLAPTGTASNPGDFAVLNGVLIFAADAADGKGRELWRTTGTLASTTRIADINIGSASSSPQINAVLATGGPGGAGGPQVVFEATTVATGRELYRTDGNTVTLVSDINPGTASGDPFGITIFNGLLYLNLTTPANGREIFTYNGLTISAAPVVEINPGAGSAAPASFAFLDAGAATPSQLVFTATDAINGAELRVLDLNANTVTLVEDTSPGSAGAAPIGTFVLNGDVFYYGDSVDPVLGTLRGQEPRFWTGTLGSPTSLISDIRPGTAGSFVGSGFGSDTTRVYFTAQVDQAGVAGTVSGAELYAASPAGAFIGLVLDDPGSVAVVPVTLPTTTLPTPNASVGAATFYFNPEPTVLLFRARDNFNTPTDTGAELYRSTGGVLTVQDLAPGVDENNIPFAGNPIGFFAFGGVNYFSANVNTGSGSGVELYSISAPYTPANVTLVADIANDNGGGVGGGVSFSAFDADTFLFRAANFANGTEPWQSDGTAGGTSMLIDLLPQTTIVANSPTITAGVGTLASGARSGVDGARIDRFIAGDTAGGIRRAFFLADTTPLTPAGVAPANGEALGLWATDGTPAGTFFQGDTNVGTQQDVSAILTGSDISGGAFYYRALNSFGVLNELSVNVSGFETHRATGLANSATILDASALNPGSASSPTEEFIVLPNGDLIASLNAFVDADGFPASNNEVFRISAGGLLAQRLTDINPAGDSAPSDFTIHNLGGVDKLVFWATDGFNGRELYTINISDITAVPFSTTAPVPPVNATRISDINVGAGGSDPAVIFPGRTVFNGRLYFTATEPVGGIELYSTDGTLAGTALVEAIATGAAGSGPSDFVQANGELYFIAGANAPSTLPAEVGLTGFAGVELYRVVSPTNVELVADLNPGSGSGVLRIAAGEGSTNLIAAPNGRLYFGGNDGVLGAELYSLDPTTGTVALEADLFPGVVGSFPIDFFLFNDTLFFTAQNGDTGREIYSISFV